MKMYSWLDSQISSKNKIQIRFSPSCKTNDPDRIEIITLLLQTPRCFEPIHRLITLINKSKTVAKLCEIKSYEVGNLKKIQNDFSAIQNFFFETCSKLQNFSLHCPSTPANATKLKVPVLYCTKMLSRSI